jgi:hypothetical protein
MGYALGKVGKEGRTFVVSRREDAGTDDGKGDRGGLSVPLLNITMPWAAAGTAGIAIAAVLRVAAAHVTIFILSNLPYTV